MVQNYNISIFLDTRRAKSNGKYPVKLRVYTGQPRKQKLYSTVFEFTEVEYQDILKGRGRDNKESRTKIRALETKANDVAKNLNPFTFDQFERQLYRKPGDGISVSYHYEEVIEDLKRRGQVGTANTYELSKRSITKFLEATSTKKFDRITFYDVTVDWLKDYEYWMVTTEDKSQTTVSIYLRSLKALYNKAIEEKEIELEFYPFGKRKYQVPNSKNVKKALTKEQLKTLRDSKPRSEDQKKARDFWLFSFACNGMNIKDIALLTYGDIADGVLEFKRAKTKITSKTNLKPIRIPLNTFTKRVIKKYGNNNKDPENLIFDIVNKDQNPDEQQRKVKNFTRFINQHLKNLAKVIELPGDISTYWARHSFATFSVREKNVSLEFIQERLGHNNIKTTQNYFAGFDDETMKEFSNSIMDFD